MNIHSSILQYQSYMDSVIDGLNYIYGCFELFVLEKISRIYVINNYLICNSTMSGLLILSHIDSNVIYDNNICLCLTCNRSVLLKNWLMFEILNGFFYMNY